jgi:anti-anti-sigma factor
VPAARRSIWSGLQPSAGLIVDLEGVSFIDSAGLGLLLVVNREVTRRGGRWALVGASPAVTRILEITRADRLLPLFIGLSDVERAWSEQPSGCPESREAESEEPEEPLPATQRLT